MGSLMAGWDSHVADPKSVALERNRSFTKEEIEAYWRSKRKAEDDHSSKDHVEGNNNNNIYGRSKSLPVSSSNQDWTKNMGSDQETKLEQFLMKNAWWRRSNWAFLNEPPVLESTANTYQSQFHVASTNTSSA